MTNKVLTRKQQALVSHMHRQEPTSIYQLARLSGRPYRRVHDHVRLLERMGLVRLEETVRNSRKTILVVSNDPDYQRLLRLDDMYAAWRELAP